MNEQEALKKFGRDFAKAVQEKDVPGLRSHLATAIRFEPASFGTENGEYRQMRKYLEAAGIEFKQSYEPQADEEERPRGSWDMSYFFHLVEWYRLNCADKRLEHLKEVGKAVSPAPKKSPVSKMAPQTHQGVQDTSFHPALGERRGQGKQKNRPNLILLWLAVAVLVILLVASVFLWREKPQDSGAMFNHPGQVAQEREQSSRIDKSAVV